MDKASEGRPAMADSDFHALALVFDQADDLEKCAHAMYARATALRAQSEITIKIAPAQGMPGQFDVLTRVGGIYRSGRLAASVEDACQAIYITLQGFQPPPRLPPFGTPVDRTLPALAGASDMSPKNQ